MEGWALSQPAIQCCHEGEKLIYACTLLMIATGADNTSGNSIIFVVVDFLFGFFFDCIHNTGMTYKL